MEGALGLGGFRLECARRFSLVGGVRRRRRRWRAPRGCALPSPMAARPSGPYYHVFPWVLSCVWMRRPVLGIGRPLWTDRAYGPAEPEAERRRRRAPGAGREESVALGTGPARGTRPRRSRAVGPGPGLGLGLLCLVTSAHAVVAVGVPGRSRSFARGVGGEVRGGLWEEDVLPSTAATYQGELRLMHQWLLLRSRAPRLDALDPTRTRRQDAVRFPAR